MNTNIEISNINKHFFPINERNEEEDNKKYITKIINYCFSSINEADISDKIKNISYYSNEYLVVEDYDFINISQLNDKYIEKLNINDNKRYLIFKYKNDHLINFYEFLFNFSDPKTFFFIIIESFSYLLKSLIKLNNENICFFNLSPQNIVFNLDCGEKPQLLNFQLSLQVSKLNTLYINNIIENQNDYTHKPLEVHVLFYLIKNDISSISYSFIEEICEIFVNKLSILSLFSKKYKESYKLLCIQSLKKYINKSKKDIINDILNQYDKWDVYSLSIIYLHIFGNICRIFSLNQTFISKFIVELSKNISPEPLNRNSLEDFLVIFNKLCNEQKDWTFTKKLESNKMMHLFKILDK